MIRLATLSDISHIVTIHRSELPQDFLPRLGQGILMKFYKTFLEKDNYIILWEDNSTIHGFIALPIDSSFSKKVISRYYKELFLKLLTSPNLWGEALWFLFSSTSILNSEEITLELP